VTPTGLGRPGAWGIDMSDAHYGAEVIWTRGEQAFRDKRYSREHRIRFDGGLEIAGSASPHSVPVPMSNPAAVDPEEAFIAALASCHMLWFLAIAAKRDYCVDRYHDRAIGVMGRNSDGRTAMTVVTLRPAVAFSGARTPSRDDVTRLHHDAHEECFIANSVRTEVRCEPVFDPG
jgi:organic hydroperoxide reductase OsmC/OhrA